MSRALKTYILLYVLKTYKAEKSECQTLFDSLDTLNSEHWLMKISSEMTQCYKINRPSNDLVAQYIIACCWWRRIYLKTSKLHHLKKEFARIADKNCYFWWWDFPIDEDRTYCNKL